LFVLIPSKARDPYYQKKNFHCDSGPQAPSPMLVSISYRV
jgi:hypothetical protein